MRTSGTRNLLTVVSSCVTISSCVTMSHCVGMSVYGDSLLVWVTLLQGACSQQENIYMVRKCVRKQRPKPNQQRREGIVRWYAPRCGGRPMSSGNLQNGMMSALWETWCDADSNYHEVVRDGASGQGCGPICQTRVVESQVRAIERAEKRSTPQEY